MNKHIVIHTTYIFIYKCNSHVCGDRADVEEDADRGVDAEHLF